jgi:hypothetical protein
MTQKKKAELQRKLSMAPVARPPGDLLDRLKSDIPNDLMSTRRDRERVSRSMAFSLRVAAAIVFMIASTFALVQFLARDDATRVKGPVAAAELPQSKSGGKPLRRGSGQAPHSEVKMAEVTVTMADSRRKDEPARMRQTAKEAPRALVGGVVGGVAAEVAANVQSLPAPPPPPAVSEPAFVVAQDRAESITVTQQAPAAPAPATSASLMMREARAADFAYAAPKTVFGISVDSGEFGRLKDLIEKGQTPEAREVNVEALVNHFAGLSPPRRDVRLQVEGSRAPLAGEVFMLRYTIDTAETSRRGSLPPVATNARLDIELNSKAISNYRIVADGASISATEPMLVMNLSATGLIEIELAPNVRPRDRIATVRLRYHSITDGRDHTLMKSVDVHELSRSWISASRRHRLATLGAVWGESLKGKATTASDVARRAEELAKETPSEPLARDLANAASASSRLQTSAPTGSGR